MNDKLVCYIYTAYFAEDDRSFEITKHPHLAEKITENGKYQVAGYSGEWNFYDDEPEEWVWDIDKEQKYIMVDYITLDPNSEQNFKDRLIKQLMRRLFKELKGE